MPLPAPRLSFLFLFLSFSIVSASPAAIVHAAGASDEKGEPPGSSAFWYKLIVSVGLVLLGGVFAG